MEIYAVGAVLLGIPIFALAGYLVWRFIWFYRNPSRRTPGGDNLVSPADGTVVYVKKVEPHEEVIAIKQGLTASINDIVVEDLASPKILIGIFMSPFNVHYNRAPLSCMVEFIRHHPAKAKNLHMGPMHLRTLLKRPPFCTNCRHIVENERTVTKVNGEFKGNTLPCYIVQIAGKSVSGIDSYVKVGDGVDKGSIFGMIRIGSQVDLVVPAVKGMNIRVQPGDKVRAGETILID